MQPCPNASLHLLSSRQLLLRTRNIFVIFLRQIVTLYRVTAAGTLSAQLTRITSPKQAHLILAI